MTRILALSCIILTLVYPRVILGADQVLKVSCHQAYEKFTTKGGDLVYGYLTTTGVSNLRDYQSLKGLHVDGIAGPLTLRALRTDSRLSEIDRTPLSIQFSESGAMQVELVVSNRTDRFMSLVAGHSLSKETEGNLNIRLPVMVQASGVNAKGLSTKRVVAAVVDIQSPTVLAPRSSLKRSVKYDEKIDGNFFLRCSFVVTVGGSHISKVTAEPRYIKKRTQLAPAR
jgi:hypothetical protein